MVSANDQSLTSWERHPLRSGSVMATRPGRRTFDAVGATMSADAGWHLGAVFDAHMSAEFALRDAE